MELTGEKESLNPSPSHLWRHLPVIILIIPQKSLKTGTGTLSFLAKRRPLAGHPSWQRVTLLLTLLLLLTLIRPAIHTFVVLQHVSLKIIVMDWLEASS